MATSSRTLPTIDPFLIWLIGTVAAASLLPVRGDAAGWVGLIADLAIALLFFLHGAKLSRAAIVQGMGNWRLHGLVLSSTYILFPVVGVVLVMVMAGHADPLLLSGLLFLTLLPSTVQSSIAFTAMAGGDVAAAVCSASLSNLLGIALTPLLVALVMHGGGEGGVSSWQSVRSIALQLLAPFLAGHLLRPLIGGFVDRHKKLLQPVDRGSILLVVYSAFSAAVVGGIWSKVGLTDLLTLLALSAVVLAVIMGTNALVARLFKLPRQDAIVLFFCGSKKSLVSGVPMAGALFPAAQVGIVLLPLMIFHQLQLFLCAAMAGRFRRQGEALVATEAARAVPRAQDDIARAAADRDMAIPASCMPGVEANLALLDGHAQTLRGDA
ncbi:MAG: bile acid:sodium symporter family protein [Sphingobium sp.]